MSEEPTAATGDLADFLSHLGTESLADDDGEGAVEVIQVIGIELGGEYFIIDILNVREIVRLAELEITRVPHAHYYVLGVINLRGKVVPVVDLRARMGLGNATSSGDEARARLVVVEIGARVVGFTVDAVSEVLRLPCDQIEATDERSPYAAGVAMVDGQIMTLLQLSGLFDETATRMEEGQ